MNVIIDSLCGATAFCDTLIVKVAKVADVVCQPIMKEVETGDNDVLIVSIICATIAFVALIAKWALCSWKAVEIKAAKEERTEKEKEADIAARKQKADCLRKLLDFLEKRTSKKEEFRDEESQYYIKVLQSQINGKQIPEVPVKKN